ncbi:hypothetical protein L208DRAFT_1417321 [Tricholoma matsutake]|nr:hypothetical protein L208DRAFT_1417321 [Tricholoma matsutake 945]
MHHTLGPHESFLLWVQSATDRSIIVLQKSAGWMYRGFLLNRLSEPPSRSRTKLSLSVVKILIYVCSKMISQSYLLVPTTRCWLLPSPATPR